MLLLADSVVNRRHPALCSPTIGTPTLAGPPDLTCSHDWPAGEPMAASRKKEEQMEEKAKGQGGAGMERGAPDALERRTESPALWAKQLEAMVPARLAQPVI